ncbi:MAG: hypothetical protein DI586_05880 [Micavibrio aeruginosavorus]|uniref:AB hydrolase-1 domain-containing protein n=1 Tax=Micavibrio aeruginosavorus TaxID=349221 RepID=A0A2W5FMZ9_9BACT|nr:MAG: hypothetical protein DI586_05880 [Micavibrio aeruginosavorus]
MHKFVNAAKPLTSKDITSMDKSGRSRHKPLVMHLTLAAATLADPQFQENETIDEAFWQKPEGKNAKASMKKVVSGIRNYQLHSFKRPETKRPIIWQDGEVRVFHYLPKKKVKGRILVIPSMINGSEILDLLPDKSMMNWLAEKGFESFLLDWGDLTNDKELKSIDHALGKKIKKLLKWLKAQSDLPLTGLGYCMGGLLLAATDQLYPKAFGNLVFIATPWDFKKDTKGNFSESVINWAKDGLPQTMHLDYMPAQWLQMIFAGVDASLIARKFSAFADMDQSSKDAELFVAVEDWVNGGSDLPTSIVHHTVGGWYVDNKPVKGEWEVAGKIISPENIAKPAFIIVPGRDKIVPPASARPLGKKIKKVKMIEPDCGHISMMVGRNAETEVWIPMRNWIISQRNIETKP